MQWLIGIYYIAVLGFLFFTFPANYDEPFIWGIVAFFSIFIFVVPPMVFFQQKKKYKKDMESIQKDADEEIMKNNRNALLGIDRAQKSAEDYYNAQLEEYEQYISEFELKAETILSENTAELERLKKINVLEIDKLFTHLKDNVSTMDGKTYEAYVGYKISNDGWHNITYTPLTGDYGADIIANDKDGRRTCIQCKRYENSVGVEAVQEVLAAKQYYNAERAVVATNSVLTSQAHNMAQKTGVELWEHFV